MAHDSRHRGAHPVDAKLFADSQLPVLRTALHDLCWLLSRGYAEPSSLKLVGDRFHLFERQRLLLMRSACTDTQRVTRRRTRREASEVKGCDLYLDGFNVLITIECALSGGFLFVGQDGCCRDLSSVHGTYKRVMETLDAIGFIGRTMQSLGVRRAVWLLDRPVSNSGRLRQLLLETAQRHGWNWDVQLCQSPDSELKQVSGIVVSTDSVILDAVQEWFHLNDQVIRQHVPDARMIDLRSET